MGFNSGFKGLIYIGQKLQTIFTKTHVILNSHYIVYWVSTRTINEISGHLRKKIQAVKQRWKSRRNSEGYERNTAPYTRIGQTPRENV